MSVANCAEWARICWADRVFVCPCCFESAWAQKRAHPTALQLLGVRARNLGQVTHPLFVIPRKPESSVLTGAFWMPAFAGMTTGRSDLAVLELPLTPFSG